MFFTVLVSEHTSTQSTPGEMNDVERTEQTLIELSEISDEAQKNAQQETDETTEEALTRQLSAGFGQTDREISGEDN